MTEKKIEGEMQNLTKRALLVACFKKNSQREECEEHLNELKFLAETHGVATAHQVACPLKKVEASTYIGSGKVEELAEIVRDDHLDLVIFDEDISPAQQRNLEEALKVTVMDRTELILAVFAERAQTKEARLQIELAQVKYQYPRLKRLWTHLSRQQGSGGGGVFVKGEGEKQIEIDRRLIKKRIEQLEHEIEKVSSYRKTQRTLREKTEIPTFAMIGYTNVGKSTLLNALTDANVFVENKLFSTLDTTTRKFTLPNQQEILLIDTVGFIRKLPHLLVAAFRSTLEEALQADILLHIVDVSHPQAEAQAEASTQVLKELTAQDKPVITVLNKIDQCQDLALIQRMRLKYPFTVTISALKGQGFDELTSLMLKQLEGKRREVTLLIPQSEYGVATEIMRSGKILKKEYDGDDIILTAQVSIPSLGRLQKYIQNEERSK